MASCLARGLPRCTEKPVRTGRLAVVAAGPSVRDYLEEIRGWDGEVWAINGAYDYLRANGIVPHGFMAIDPLPGLAEYVKNPHPDTTFYLSSVLDPSVFDALEGYNIKVWFADQDAVTFPSGVYVVGGGTTAITRAPFLARMLGWRDITFFGADSSFDDGESRYCYGYRKYGEDSKANVLKVNLPTGEGPFYTELCLMKQVAQMGTIAMYLQGTKIDFRCKGLMDAYIRSPVL